MTYVLLFNAEINNKGNPHIFNKNIIRIDGEQSTCEFLQNTAKIFAEP